METQFSTHLLQAQRVADGASQYESQYGSEAVPRSAYDVQQTHVQR